MLLCQNFFSEGIYINRIILVEEYMKRNGTYIPAAFRLAHVFAYGCIQHNTAFYGAMLIWVNVTEMLLTLAKKGQIVTSIYTYKHRCYNEHDINTERVLFDFLAFFSTQKLYQNKLR